MNCSKRCFLLFVFVLIFSHLKAQGTTAADLMSQLEKEVIGDARTKTTYTIATFKTTRLINGHTVESVGRNVLDLKISHRFGKVNGGGYQFFGLDNATMRLGFDYGVTKLLMIGIGRSTFQKTYDGYFKVKLLRQSSGKRNIPFALSYIPSIALKTLKDENPNRKNYFRTRLYYTHQLLIARKFSEGLSLQLTPTFSHRNLVQLVTEHNSIPSIGIGGRQKLSKRISLNAEYFYQFPHYKLTGTTNSLSAGIDIETGGHVFQLHFTNSQGMSERTFISETTGKWSKGDIFFGFNISRVFTLGKKK